MLQRVDVCKKNWCETEENNSGNASTIIFDRHETMSLYLLSAGNDLVLKISCYASHVMFSPATSLSVCHSMRISLEMSVKPRLSMGRKPELLEQHLMFSLSCCLHRMRVQGRAGGMCVCMHLAAHCKRQTRV